MMKYDKFKRKVNIFRRNHTNNNILLAIDIFEWIFQIIIIIINYHLKDEKIDITSRKRQIITLREMFNKAWKAQELYQKNFF